MFAVRDGIVVESEAGRITLDHHPTAPGLVSRYLHLKRRFVTVEDPIPKLVREGQLIGSVGGTDFGPHLHFELHHGIAVGGVRQSGEDLQILPVDPIRALYRSDRGRFVGTEQTRLSGQGQIEWLRTYDWRGLPFFSLRLKDEESGPPQREDGPLGSSPSTFGVPL